MTMTCNFIKNGDLILVKYSQLSSVNISAINLNKTTTNLKKNIIEIIKKIIKYFIIFLILIIITCLIRFNLTKDFIIELSSNNPEPFFNVTTDNFLIDSLKKQTGYSNEPKVNIPNFQKIEWQKDLPLTRNQFTVPFDFGSPSNYLIEQFGQFTKDTYSNPIDPQELTLKLEELKNNQDNEELNNNHNIFNYAIISVTVIVLAVSTVIIFNNPQIISFQ